jgi:membrane-associated phospholipid phosphatase
MSRQSVAVVGMTIAIAIAAVPFLGSLDAAIALQLDRSRTCAGKAFFNAVSNGAQPVGFWLVVAALALSLVRGERPRLSHAAQSVVAFFAGSFLLEAIKDFIERPRPGVEFLDAHGNSFPSGHVGNAELAVFALLTLVMGRSRARLSMPWFVGVVAVVAVMGFTRMYLGRHWLSDVIGTAALFGGYAAVAFLHPDVRWRMGASAAAAVVALTLTVAASLGQHLEMAAGTAGGGASPTWKLAFGTALEEGKLRGDWSRDAYDARRSSAWMRESPVSLEITAAPPAREIRIVARPHPAGGSSSCRRLGVALNGVVLGDRLLHFGWRGYRFPVRSQGDDAFSRGAVFTFTVQNELPERRRERAPLVAFSEISLH